MFKRQQMKLQLNCFMFKEKNDYEELGFLTEGKAERGTDRRAGGRNPGEK